MAGDQANRSGSWANKGGSGPGFQAGRPESIVPQPGASAGQADTGADGAHAGMNRPEPNAPQLGAGASGTQPVMDDGQVMRSIVRDDAYTVVRVLADGPAGRTELVTLDDEGPLVRKRIPSSLANVSAWAVAMEVDEPLLPRIEELYRMPDALVVVYDYVEGQSLRELVEAEGRLSAPRAGDIICDVCHSVGVLHEHGVIHRDVTPGNVIAARDGAHLVDLGIARQRSEGQRRDTTTLGTWGYAAPEQYGFAQTDARSDVYGIGRLLGYLLTAVTPGDDAYDQALDELAQMPSHTGLVQAVRKATKFEPSARYQTAADLAQAVREAAHASAQGAAREAASRATDARPFTPQGTARPPEPQHTARTAASQAAASGLTQHDSARPPVSQPAASATVPRPATRSQRAFSDAPLGQRILILALWGLLGGFALLTILTSIVSAATGNPPWKAGHQALAWAVVAYCVAAIRETCLAITYAGPYGEAPRPAARCASVLLAYFGLLIVALFLFAAFLPS